ncbi:MAG: CFI-box-CTERM domain-containing protein [Sandaracinaceae bacterium]
MLRFAAVVVLAALVGNAELPAASAQDGPPRVLDVAFHPTRRAQVAVWIETADGTFLRTLALTQATATRGIGNRPGASQMNSGFLWPYGRREGVLPIWAQRRAAAPGAELFRRVIFQDRVSEGHASRSSSDFSEDPYFCLSFDRSASEQDNLDAVTCPSIFNSDKGRYLTEADVAQGYSEPAEGSPGVGEMRPLALGSLYPPRRDVQRCTRDGCYDHPDVASFADDARAAMPEIDAVTRATAADGERTMIQLTIPDEWPDGDYVVFVEVNVEGDHNSVWSREAHPTPTLPDTQWDYWAMSYGYPYRGQPSVVYRVPVRLDLTSQVETTAEPWGYGSLEGGGEPVAPMDGTITDDAAGAPGSGADRLYRQPGDWRVRVEVLGAEACEDNAPPSAVEELAVLEYEERRDAHRFAQLSFRASEDDEGVGRYEVRVGTEPIVDVESFERAAPARTASLEIEALSIPVGDPAGALVDVDIGGLAPETTFYVAVRPVDRCNLAGPIQAVSYTTPAIEFTTVSPCFVATAAYGTPLADEIGTLRRLRDRYLEPHPMGRAAVRAYEAVGPAAARWIEAHESRRAVARALLAPLVALASALPGG